VITAIGVGSEIKDCSSNIGFRIKNVIKIIGRTA
jgi:hypothetical protein